MPVAKLRSNTVDALKPMADNSANTYIRQAVGNESLLSFSRAGDSPVQWFQLLNALDQQDLQGWPFLAPVKIQMQKCDKCSKEFCSPINYRRHMRVHRRSLRADKEWHKNRDLLAAFWDKLSSEATGEIVSFDDVTLEEVPGSSIIWSLTSFVRKPGYGAFPQQYVKAGSALLDIIQSRPARLPISSQELFAILDDASEGTFLCAGTAESMQKFVFDGEAGKIGMEPKNLVACTSFLVEQKLVRKWVADMDAESLRCQQLLVEEEEAAQRRQAKLLERKRQKKLRQKEQKAKEQGNGETAALEEATVITLDRPSSSETTNLSVSSESSSSFIDVPADHPFSFSLSVESAIIQKHEDDPQSGFTSLHSDSGPYPNIENQKAFGSERKQTNVYRWQVQKTPRARNGFHSGHDPHLSKFDHVQRHGLSNDQRPTQAVNGNKVWTRKPKPEHDSGDSFNTQVEKSAPNCKSKPIHDNGVSCDTRVKKAATTRKPNREHDNRESISTRVEKVAPTQGHQTDKNYEVMIGSISVTLGNCNSQQQSDPPQSEDSGQEKHTEINGRVSRSRIKLWRHVSPHGNRGQNGGGELTDDIARENNEQAVVSESCQQPCDSDGNANENDLQEGTTEPEGFSTEAAKAFLSHRWKEAIAGDHVTLVLSPETELFDSEDAEKDYLAVKTSSDAQSRIVLGNADNQQDNVVVFEPSTNRPAKGKFKSNIEKGIKTKYIPKKKTVTRGK